MAKRKRTIVWADVVDLDLAYSNVYSDFFGDWYRDPWGWPEMKWLSEKRQDLVAARLDDRHFGRVALLDVPKENFGTRPAVVLDPIDRLAYQSLVDHLSVTLIGDLSESAFGWRLNRRSPKAGHYNNNGEEQRKYRRHIEMFGGSFPMAGLKTDVVSFFANIDVPVLIERVYQICGAGIVTDSLAAMLLHWDSNPSRTGIPQRASASSVLANFFLMPLDDKVLRALPTFKRPETDAFRAVRETWKVITSGATSRWMDDIWIFGRDVSSLRKTQFDIETMLRELELDMNIAKTDVLEGTDLHAEILRWEHSAVDGALLNGPKNLGPLEALVYELIEDPEHRSRSSFKFALKRLREHELYDQADDLAAVAARAPHAADAFARFFRDSKTYRDMYSWFLNYWKSNWSTTDWAVAQLGTMFPADRTRKRLAERYASYLERPTGSLALTALAAQRLAQKDPKKYRSLIRSSIKSSAHPLERRVLVLAGLGCSIERPFLRKALKEFGENAYLLELLEERQFKPFSVLADFSGY